MKLLILTQKVDKKDPVLGFFHRWLEVFSKHCEQITVICLYKGEVDLPDNVKVLSLGKEEKQSRLQYIIRFYKYIFTETYDSVFVHMNQEYVLLGGLFWKLLKKKVYMWRNHHAGSVLTDIAAIFCTNVFCTSRFSYTAKYKKTRFMPVGVDLENFKAVGDRMPQTVLSLGRIAPSKHIDLLLKLPFKINIYGDALEKDRAYFEQLKKEAGPNVTFFPGVPNIEAVAVYSKYDIFVNLSSSGMYDKTIFEAIACGCLILASNENLRGNIPDDFIFEQNNTAELEEKINRLLTYSPAERSQAVSVLQGFAQKHSLQNLAYNLFQTL